jgi:hypothetical protein
MIIIIIAWNESEIQLNTKQWNYIQNYYNQSDQVMGKYVFWGGFSYYLIFETESC